jgi:hypothetical protein
VLALLLYACSGSGSGKKQPIADGKSTGGPGASQSSVPNGGGSSTQASGGSNGASGGSGTPGTGPSGTASGPGCQLSLSLTTQSPAYANGDSPQFTVAVVNKGSSDCDVDVSPKSLVLNVYSGPDHIWSSADCFTGAKDVRGIAPGAVQTVSYTWNRTRSTQSCPANPAAVKLGMYYGVVSLAQGNGPNAPEAQSQPKTFELKTGS